MRLGSRVCCSPASMNPFPAPESHTHFPCQDPLLISLGCTRQQVEQWVVTSGIPHSPASSRVPQHSNPCSNLGGRRNEAGTAHSLSAAAWRVGSTVARTHPQHRGRQTKPLNNERGGSSDKHRADVATWETGGGAPLRHPHLRKSRPRKGLQIVHICSLLRHNMMRRKGLHHDRKRCGG